MISSGDLRLNYTCKAPSSDRVTLIGLGGRKRTHVFTVHPSEDSDSLPASGDTCRLQAPGPHSRDLVADDPGWGQSVKTVCGLLGLFLSYLVSQDQLRENHRFQSGGLITSPPSSH